MSSQKGVLHLLPLLLVLVLIIGAALFFLFKDKFNLPSSPFQTSTGPKVEVKTEYKNPFKKETQYVNPFDEYKSPFLNFEQ